MEDIYKPLLDGWMDGRISLIKDFIRYFVDEMLDCKRDFVLAFMLQESKLLLYIF